MNENLEDLKQKADQLDKNERWDELIPVYTEIIALEQEPLDKARAYVQRGIAYGKNSEYDKAIVDFTKALKLEPNNMFACCNRGLAYLEKGAPDQAIADFNKALGLQLPDTMRAKVYFDRGNAYFLKGYDDQAIEDFSKMLELSLDLDDRLRAGMAYWGRAIAYFAKNSLLDAFENFKEAGKCNEVLKSASPKIYIASKIADIHERSDEEEGGRAFELYFRLLEAISKIQNKLFYAPQENVEVAHYTSLHTLKTLAKRNRFRFYNADYMNDPEEGRVFFEIMKESGIDVQEGFYGDDAPPYPSPAYIGSLVKVDAKEPQQKDELFLWRTYGKHGGQEAAGACLIFKHEGTVFAEKCSEQIGGMQQLQSKLLVPAVDILNPEKKQPFKPELYETIYIDEGNKQKLSEELKKLAESLKQIQNYISEKDDRIKDKLKQLVRDLLDPIRFLFKARHYREEDEVRVVQVRYYDETKTAQEPDDIQVDMEQIPPRFYLETHENFRFSEVILGPQTRGVPEWKRWLKKRDIKVDQSEIQYGKPYL